jgi:hypothetical protein
MRKPFSNAFARNARPYSTAADSGRSRPTIANAPGGCPAVDMPHVGQKSVSIQTLLCRVHPAMARCVPSGDGIAATE